MAKTETTKNGFADVAKAFDVTKAFDMSNVTKAFSEMKLPGIDVEAVVAAQRKNLEAFTQANQLAVEGAQSFARRQVEIIRQAVDEASQALREWTEAGAPEDRVAKSVELSKAAYEKGIANAKELTEHFGVVTAGRPWCGRAPWSRNGEATGRSSHEYRAKVR